MKKQLKAILIEEKERRFRIGKSKIPRAGRGLFAKIPLQKGDRLVVIGVVIQRGGAADDCTKFADRYKFRLSGGRKLLVPIGFGGMVNHCSDRQKINARIERKRTGICWTFLRAIKAGEEILGRYGASYFRGRRANFLPR